MEIWRCLSCHNVAAQAGRAALLHESFKDSSFFHLVTSLCLRGRSATVWLKLSCYCGFVPAHGKGAGERERRFRVRGFSLMRDDLRAVHITSAHIPSV